MSDTVREFSRKVRMRLRAGVHDLDVEQFGGDFLITSYPIEVEPCVATMTLTLDDTHDDSFTIYLVDGINPQRIEQPVLMQQ